MTDSELREDTEISQVDGTNTIIDYKVYPDQGVILEPKKSLEDLVENNLIYDKMRDFDFKLSYQYKNSIENYDINQLKIKRLIKFCQDKNVNPFPILHQLCIGFFVIVN